jgi:hypothetical protein
MKTIGKPVVLLVAMTVIGCSNKKQTSDVLVKANQIHLETAGIHQRLEKQLDSARAVTTNPVYRRSLDSLSNLVELWENAMLEVPGFEHAHNSNDAHHHHNTAPAMTDESMLEYQQNAYMAIVELEKSFTGL